MDEMQRRVGKWGEETFPEATDASILAHLQEEIGELDRAVFADLDPNAQENVREEAGDCLLMLYHSARVKFEANKRRTWEPVAGGYWKHTDEVAK